MALIGLHEMHGQMHPNVFLPMTPVIISLPSLAGQPLHARRKGLVSCLYVTCSFAVRSAATIRFIHVILNHIVIN